MEQPQSDARSIRAAALGKLRGRDAAVDNAFRTPNTPSDKLRQK
jgi:hypothetical protein